MYTFNDFMNMGELQDQAVARIQADMNNLKAQQETKLTAMKMAATVNDAKAYTKAETDFNMLGEQIQAKVAELAQPVPYTPENVLAAWADYATEHNDALCVKMAEYEAARHEAARAYRELVDLQNTALKARAHFVGLLGGTDAGLDPITMLDNTQKVKSANGSRAAQVDILYFILTGEYPRANFAGLEQIIDYKVPATISDAEPYGVERNVLATAHLLL